MEELLPYYERELAFLRKYSREFAQRYPKVAGRLQLTGEVCEDPHVERMIEAFALMNARVSKKLDDDYPEFTEALLEALYPHYLRPFPACSIARFDAGPAAAQLSAPQRIARGTELTARPVKGATCRFRTAYDVTVAPVRLAEARFLGIAQPPAATRLRSESTGQVSIRFEMLGDTAKPEALGMEQLRVFIDGEPSFCAALRDALFLHTLDAYVEAGSGGAGAGRWVKLGELPIKPVGLAESDALIEFDARSHPAYRLLTEYFAFPEKFNFFDVATAPIRALLGANLARGFTLHLVLGGIRSDSGTARLLESLGAHHLLLGCTPVVNQFPMRGDPIRLTHQATSYPVVADGRRAYAYEVVAIESVRLVRQTPAGENITEYRPFYGLRHGEAPSEQGHYWVAHRDPLVATKSPGYELEISIVDLDLNPAAPQTDTLSVALTCCNRDLPSLLPYGVPGGDLFIEGGSSLRSIALLRKPGVAMRFEAGRGAHWRLISQLSLNHLSLSQSGLSAFKEMLRLYDLPRTAITARLIDGIVGLAHKPVNAWLAGNPFATIVRGMEVQLTVNEGAFVGSGLHLFALVMEEFFALYVSANSFTQLVLVSATSGRELVRTKPKSGGTELA